MKRAIRIFTQIIAGIFSFCGVVPLCLFGHINSGNTALILFGTFAFLLSFFWNQLQVRRTLAIARNILAIMLTVCFICGFLISGVMVWFGYFHTPPSKTAGTVVVLGCEIQGDEPSRVLKARLDAALDYLRNHPETPVIVAGGVGDDELYSEAYVMYRYLIKNGIDKSRIYCEDRSKDTEQNITFAREIIRENDLPDTMFIATDGFHELRAFLHARENGHRAYALPVHNFTVATLSMQPEYWVREVLGILHFMFIL